MQVEMCAVKIVLTGRVDFIQPVRVGAGTATPAVIQTPMIERYYNPPSFISFNRSLILPYRSGSVSTCQSLHPFFLSSWVVERRAMIASEGFRRSWRGWDGGCEM
jgi:hypothetical protein